MSKIDMNKPTEKKIQNVLFKCLQDKAHQMIVPNCGVFGWEADLISATPSNYAHEYEIKISLNDFVQDKKKKKHFRLKNPNKKNPGPKFFWYCCPPNLIKKPLVPKHAGLIYIYNKYIKVIKTAPRLHSIKLPQRQINYINRGLMIRYWKTRG